MDKKQNKPDELSEFANVQTLLKRKRKREKKKQLGITPGSGYELRGGVKRRMSPQKIQKLKVRGRRMARSAKQQQAMKLGRQRAASTGVTGAPAMKKRKNVKSDVDFDLSPGQYPLAEGERRFSTDHILRCVKRFIEGDVDEALRNLTIDPKYQLEPIAALADELVKKLREDGIDTYIDVEIVEGDTLAVYLEKGESEFTRVKEILATYGDTGRVALPDKALSKVENSAYHIFMLKPTDKVLASFKSAGVKGAEDGKEEAVGSSGVSGFVGNVGVNIPPMVTVGGTGTDPNFSPPKDDVAHLRTTYDDKFAKKWKKKKKKDIEKKANLPLGKDPNLGTDDFDL